MNTHTHTVIHNQTQSHTNYVRDYAKSESQSESESECEHVRGLCDHFAMRTSCQATDCKQQQQQQHTSKHSSSSAGECVKRGVAGEGGNVLRLHVHLNAAWFDYKAAINNCSWHGVHSLSNSRSLSLSIGTFTCYLYPSQSLSLYLFLSPCFLSLFATLHFSSTLKQLIKRCEN